MCTLTDEWVVYPKLNISVGLGCQRAPPNVCMLSVISFFIKKTILIPAIIPPYNKIKVLMEILRDGTKIKDFKGFP